MVVVVPLTRQKLMTKMWAKKGGGGGSTCGAGALRANWIPV